MLASEREVVTMTTHNPDATPGTPERPGADEPEEQTADAGPVPPGNADDDAVPLKQIHRWKSEGGALHPLD